MTMIATLHARVSKLERRTMAAIGIAALAMVGVGKIGAEVAEGSTRAFDESFLLALRSGGNPSDPIGPIWFEEMMRDFSALGGSGVLVLVTLGVAGFFFIMKKRDLALMMVGSVTTGIMLSQALKWGYSRPRPDLVPALTEVYSQSFPSGHAMMSAVAYLTLGVLCARTAIPRLAKAFLLSAAVILTLLIGISRVYLGVHWPTDVIAGWAGGAAWAILCWLVLLWLQDHGKVEQTPIAQN